MSYVLEYGVCNSMYVYILGGIMGIRDVASSLCQASWLSWPISDPGRVWLFALVLWPEIFFGNALHSESQSWSEWFVPWIWKLQNTCNQILRDCQFPDSQSTICTLHVFRNLEAFTWPLALQGKARHLREQGKTTREFDAGWSLNFRIDTQQHSTDDICLYLNYI